MSYKDFCDWIPAVLSGYEEISNDKLNEIYPAISKKNMKEWLDQAVEEKIIERVGKRRIFRVQTKNSSQTDLFA